MDSFLQRKTVLTKEAEKAGGFSSSSTLFSKPPYSTLYGSYVASIHRDLHGSYIETKPWVQLSWHEFFNYNLTCHLPFSSSNTWKKIEDVEVFCKFLLIWIRWGWKHISCWVPQNKWPHSCHQGDWDMRVDPSKAEDLLPGTKLPPQFCSSWAGILEVLGLERKS